jgi:hypothetical protein
VGAGATEAGKAAETKALALARMDLGGAGRLKEVQGGHGHGAVDGRVGDEQLGVVGVVMDGRGWLTRGKARGAEGLGGDKAAEVG